MSTRSGKRIHGIQNGKEENSDLETTTVERKTRSKKVKENNDESSISNVKNKKRRNYVSYPSVEGSEEVVATDKPALKPRRKTLKEINSNVLSEIEEVVEKKPVRVTRRTRKSEDPESQDPAQEAEINHGSNSKKGKKSKKKPKSSIETVDSQSEPIAVEVILNAIKKSKKKKKGSKRSNPIVVEELKGEVRKKRSLNKSNTSVESFHSAAGSPIVDNNVVMEGDTDSKNYVVESTVGPIVVEKDNLKFVSAHVTENEKVTDLDTSPITEKLNSTFETSDSDKNNKSIRRNKRKSSLKEVNNCGINHQSPTPEKIVEKLNITFEKSDSNEEHGESYLTLNNSKNSLKKKKEQPLSKAAILDGTFDKEDAKLDSTFDKIDPQTLTTDSKSSLISSDEGTVNVTFDKSNENSRISITSDESRTENIMNTTPVLVESSMEESRQSINTSTEKRVPESIASQTPLKREGTFTKDEPEIKSPERQSMRTPSKRVSMPSPGRTPFHSGSKSAVKDKSIMNLTHSIEKPGRRSASAEPLPRATRVMFCSPVNNPAVLSQRKSKIIKSNLKGSNKSFVFDESARSSTRPARRKRSLTASEASEAVGAAAKRKRLADDLQLSVDRLSRPRTVSATPKVDEPVTPSKKAGTPSSVKLDGKSRAKLPNFAALHQRRFDKMESLDECQQRKAKRAKQLLLPTGSLTVLERTSPKVSGSTTAEPVKPEAKPVKKPETPTKGRQTTTETKPKDGYTRFGFKLNLDVNPFSITKPSNTVVKPRAKPNGVLKRENTLPSLSSRPLPSLVGATSTRKIVAKQTIMREKSLTSFSDRRDLKRNENRTIIKGVRTNRRFELQMQSRNING